MSKLTLDLWSNDIKVDVLTPLAILRSQEGPLQRKTHGLLRASVSTTTADAWEQHSLDLIAPSLSDYRTTLLSARHPHDHVYPVVVTSRTFAPETRNVLGTGPTTGLSRSEPDEREAATEQEFVELGAKYCNPAPFVP